MAEGLDGLWGGVGGQEVGRALTEALHGIRAEDLAGPLRPEVVTGNIFTVAPTEHQLVAVFFLLRFQILVGQDPFVYAVLIWALTWGSVASANLVGWGYPQPEHPLWCALLQTRAPGLGSRLLRAGGSQSSQTYTPPSSFLGMGSALFPPVKLKTRYPDRSKNDTTHPNPL